MTSPAPVAKFADEDDVADRFEGTIPASRSTWLATRIVDVENALMGLVPSLRKPVADIVVDSEAAGDPGRLARVKSLVCDKVLDLYRNPNKSVAVESQTMESDTVSRTYAGGFQSRPPSVSISFTDTELDAVKLRRPKRPRLSTIAVAPWRPGCV